MSLDPVGSVNSTTSTQYAHPEALDRYLATNKADAIHGRDLDQIVAHLSENGGGSQAEVQARREAALEGLFPVDQGRLLRAFDEADAAVIAQMGNGADGSAILALKATTATTTTASPKKTVAATSEANLKTFDKPKSPNEAPATIKLPTNIQASAEKLRTESIRDGSIKPNEGAIIGDRKSGSLSYLPVGGKYNNKMQVLVGTIINFPQNSAIVMTPEVGGTMAALSSSDKKMVVVQDGIQQAMLVKTDKSAKNIDEAKLRQEYAANYQKRIDAGFSESDAIKYANMEAAQKYGYAYYEGKGGTLNRADTSKAGKPGFQSKPPGENPNKIAISNDYLGVTSIKEAPATLNLNASAQAALDTAAKNSFPDGKPLEQGGVILFDRTTGQMVLDKFDTVKSTSGTIQGAYAVKDPDRYVYVGSFHTHPAQTITNSDGSKGTAAETFSPTDIANFVNGGSSVGFVQYSTKDGKDKSQYMMVRTAETPSNATEAEIAARIDSYLEELASVGSKASALDQYRLAVELTLKDYGIAAYSGENGKFTKAN